MSGAQDRQRGRGMQPGATWTAMVKPWAYPRGRWAMIGAAWG